MLHLRLRVPTELTERALGVLENDDTVTNVACQPDVYRKPHGALVIADVARENASSVIAALRDLDLQRSGSISVTAIDTILSDDADRAQRLAPGASDDGVVWESVEQQLRRDADLSWAFVAFMTLAALIAGAGRINDQPILIVGAMVVGPEFAAIATICFGLFRPRPAMIVEGVRSLVLGFAIAAAIATLVWLVSYHLGGFSRHAAMSGQRTSFIVQPNGWSVAVAVLAGIAGTLSLTTGKSGPLVGVFISVTTIPAVATFALGLAVGAWPEVGSASAQLGLNVLGLIVAGTLTLLVQRAIWLRVMSHGARNGPNGRG